MLEDDRSNGGENFLGGLIIGGLLGIATGVFLCGEENRKKLRNKLDEFDFEKGIDQIFKAIEAGTREAKEVSEKIKREEEL